MATLILLTVN